MMLAEQTVLLFLSALLYCIQKLHTKFQDSGPAVWAVCRSLGIYIPTVNHKQKNYFWDVSRGKSNMIVNINLILIIL